MLFDKDDWEKLKRYADEISSYDLLRSELDLLKGRVRDLEEEVNHIDTWVEQHDNMECDNEIQEMFKNAAEEPENILEHFEKILPHSELTRYELCPHQLDDRIDDLCDEGNISQVMPSEMVCAMCWHRLYSQAIGEDNLK